MKKVLMIILVLISFETYPCTSFILRENNSLYLGKNFDYPIGSGFIFINQRDDIKTGVCLPPEKPSQWVSKYGSISFNVYGKDLPMSGMNEKGLVIETLWQDETVYPLPDERMALPELGWVQYMLDRCSTVDEVMNSDKQIRVANTSMAKVHFMILDSFGKSAIVEFIEGKTVITTRDDFPIEVLENQTYQQSIDYMQKYALGEKGYEHPMKDVRERFEMVQQMIRDKNNNDNPIDYSFNVLKTVSFTADKGYYPTQWSVVYDLKNRKICFRTKDLTTIKSIDLNQFEFICTENIVVSNLQVESGKLQPKDFHNYNLEEAKLHLRTVYEEAPVTKGKLSDEFLEQILNATNKKPCNN
jgi:choloylglycine hydrolase